MTIALWIAILCLAARDYAKSHRIAELEQDAKAAVLGDDLGFARADTAKLRQDLEALARRLDALDSRPIDSPEVTKIRKELERAIKAHEALARDLPKHIENAVSLTFYRASVATQPSKD